MADIRLNTNYIRSTHGIIKIVQIIIGFIVCSLLCLNNSYIGDRSCFHDGRVGYASGLNFVLLIINIVVFILNLINLQIYSLEKIYAYIATILLLIAAVLLIWHLIVTENGAGWFIGGTVLITVLFILFLWDVKILSGESANIVH